MTDPDLSSPAPATGTVRFAAAVTGLVVAGAAVTLSYLGLLEFAASAGIEWPYTLLFPLTVIGTVAIGFLAALQAALVGERGVFGRVLVAFGAAVLAWGGVSGTEAVAEPTALAAHVLPPVALLLTSEALLHIVRRYGPPRPGRPSLLAAARRGAEGSRQDRKATEIAKSTDRAPGKAGEKALGEKAAGKPAPGRAESTGPRGLGRGRRPADDEAARRRTQPVGADG
ncbi:MAG: DUF2637 domain-containing protein [Actinomycetales bacterium]